MPIAIEHDIANDENIGSIEAGHGESHGRDKSIGKDGAG
jgi:hypothetical protein